MTSKRALLLVAALSLFAGCRTLHVTVDGIACDAKGAPVTFAFNLRMTGESKKAEVKERRDAAAAGLGRLASASARIGIKWAGESAPTDVREVALPCSIDLDDVVATRNPDDFLGLWIQVDAPGYDSIQQNMDVLPKWRQSHYDLAFTAIMKRR